MHLLCCNGLVEAEREALVAVMEGSRDGSGCGRDSGVDGCGCDCGRDDSGLVAVVVEEEEMMMVSDGCDGDVCAPDRSCGRDVDGCDSDDWLITIN